MHPAHKPQPQRLSHASRQISGKNSDEDARESRPACQSCTQANAQLPQGKWNLTPKPQGETAMNLRQRLSFNPVIPFLTSVTSVWRGCSSQLCANLAPLPHKSHPQVFGVMTGLMSHIRSTRHQPSWNLISQLKRKISPDTNNLADSWPATTLLFLRKVIEEAVLEQGQLCL